MPAYRSDLTGPTARLLSRCELVLDLGNQPVVLGQPKDKMYIVRVAPGHQIVAGKATVGAHQNAHIGPLAANLEDNAGHLLDGTGGRVQARARQLLCQQMPPTEDVERQTTAAVVIAVEA